MKKTITKKSLLALSLILALSACDDDDEKFTETENPAWFAGDQTGNLANDVAEPITGNLIISDVNEGEDAINPKTDEATAYGTFTITADGAWSYTLDTTNAAVVALADDQVLTDTIALTSVDGTPTSIIITIKSANANVPAEFSGDLSSTINNITATAVTGQVNITDPDEGEDVAEVQTGAGTTYGTFSIDAEAKWSYTLDITNSAVVALADDTDFLTDTIEVASADGSTTDVSITITGVDDTLPPVVTIPDPVDEFAFTAGSYANTGTASDVVAEAKTSGNAAITNTAGAAGDADNAQQLAQAADAYGYITYSAVDNSGLAQLTGSYSTELVIKPSNYSEYSSDVSLIDFANTDTFEGFKTYMHKTDRNVHFKVYDGLGTSTSVSSSEALEDDTWYHIVSVYDADASEFGTITLYINGVEAKSKELEWVPVDPLDTDKAVFVGGSGSSNKNLHGAVDHIATYNEVLTEEQVTQRTADFFTPNDAEPAPTPGLTALDEFSFTAGSYANTGTASSVVSEAKTTGNAVISNTAGAMDDADGAQQLVQADDAWGYITYSAIDNSGLAQITGSYTTEIVIKPSTYAEYSSDVALIDFANTSTYEGFKVYMHKTDKNVHFKVYDGLGTSTSISSSEALVDDTWYHIVSVYDADASAFGTITLYINGVEVKSKELEWAPVDPLDSDKAVFVGGSGTSNKNLNGAVDHIATYNDAMDVTEIITRAAAFGK